MAELEPLGAERPPNDIAAAMETRHESLVGEDFFSERTIAAQKETAAAAAAAAVVTVAVDATG